jgi:hypothetical protein
MISQYFGQLSSNSTTMYAFTWCSRIPLGVSNNYQLSITAVQLQVEEIQLVAWRAVLDFAFKRCKYL